MRETLPYILEYKILRAISRIADKILACFIPQLSQNGELEFFLNQKFDTSACYYSLSLISYLLFFNASFND